MNSRDQTSMPCVSDVTFTPAHRRLLASGLLGWIYCAINGLWIDGITLRRTSDGKLVLVYPARRDRNGIQYPYVLPIDERARAAVDEQIFKTLELRRLLQ